MVPVWMILNDLWPRFQGHYIIERRITRKWYNVELCLQRQTNRKSYMIYRTAPFSMTLNDPYSRFQSQAVFDSEYLRNGTIYRHSFNGILIGTYTCPTQQCRFEWPWVILSDLAKYSVTRSDARSLCDRWASCLKQFCPDFGARTIRQTNATDFMLWDITDCRNTYCHDMRALALSWQTT